MHRRHWVASNRRPVGKAGCHPCGVLFLTADRSWQAAMARGSAGRGTAAVAVNAAGGRQLAAMAPLTENQAEAALLSELSALDVKDTHKSALTCVKL